MGWEVEGASWGGSASADWSSEWSGSLSESSERLAIRRPPRALERLKSPFMVIGVVCLIERAGLKIEPVPWLWSMDRVGDKKERHRCLVLLGGSELGFLGN